MAWTFLAATSNPRAASPDVEAAVEDQPSTRYPGLFYRRGRVEVTVPVLPARTPPVTRVFVLTLSTAEQEKLFEGVELKRMLTAPGKEEGFIIRLQATSPRDPKSKLVALVREVDKEGRISSHEQVGKVKISSSTPGDEDLTPQPDTASNTRYSRGKLAHDNFQT
jgi:hypothetical protein